MIPVVLLMDIVDYCSDAAYRYEMAWIERMVDPSIRIGLKREADSERDRSRSIHD